jgi:hypothetical protein
VLAHWADQLQAKQPERLPAHLAAPGRLLPVRHLDGESLILHLLDGML